MQVPARLTPATAADVAGALVAAYRELRGHDPPAASSWLWPLALSSNETAAWRKLWNLNVGNVTTADPASTWYANPDVTVPLKFRAFDSLRAGARSMLHVLDQHGGLTAADQGDRDAWQAALDGYLGAPYPAPWGLVASLQGVSPRAPSSGARGAAVAGAIFVGAFAFAAAARARH